VKIMCFNAVGFWGVGVTTGALLTFIFHWDLVGVWTGITLGVMATCILNLVGLAAVKWQSSSERASGSATDGTQKHVLMCTQEV
jgi:Na+-driven multidrug efflux pump